MRTLIPALADHLDGDATTICHCWRVTRRDGVVLGFTEHDHDLSFGGTDFWAASGFQPADSEAASGLSVEVGEVAGGFSSAAISEADVIAGRYDGARVEVFQVNWQAPEQRILLRVQEIGDVVRAGGAFRAELRRLTHRLDQVQGRIYGRRCDAVLGDQRCKVNLSNPAYRGSGTIMAVLGETRIAANSMESVFFTRSILRKMLRFQRIATLLYVVVWIAAFAYPSTDLEVIGVAAQAIFSGEIIGRLVRMEWLRMRCEHLFNDFNRLFNGGKGATKPITQAQIIEFFAYYETTKSTAAILLCSKIFNEQNPSLTAEWDRIRARLGI